jgi:hypothetical protein
MKKRLHGDDLLTRAELAKAIGKSKTTIRRWETTGKLDPMSKSVTVARIPGGAGTRSRTAERACLR